jgi:succinate dehydrogenase/fumarate reductase-like Fe-S protein
MSIRQTLLVTLFSRSTEFKQFQSLLRCTTDGHCMQACDCASLENHFVTVLARLQAANALNHEQQFGEESMLFLLGLQRTGPNNSDRYL